MKAKTTILIVAVPAILIVAIGVYLIVTSESRRDRRFAEQCTRLYWSEHSDGWKYDRIEHLSCSEQRKYYVEGCLRRGDEISGFYLDVTLVDSPDDPTECTCMTVYAEITNDDSFNHKPVQIHLIDD